MRRSSPAAFALVVALALVGGAAHAAPPSPSIAACLDASEQGQELRDKGKLTKAMELLEKCAVASCPAPVRTSCAKWQAEIVESMPSIIIAARSEGEEDVLDAMLAIDGGAPDKVSGRAISLDPGPHTLVVTAPRYEKVEQKLVVTTAEKNRIVRIRLARSDGAAPVTPAAASTSGREAPPSSSSSSSSSSPSSSSSSSPSGTRSSTILALGLGGLALASGAASVVVGLGARSDLDDLHSAPCAATRTCSEDETRDIKTRLVVADVALGVAVVAAAAAVYFWLSAPPSAAVKASAWRAPALTWR